MHKQILFFMDMLKVIYKTMDMISRCSKKKSNTYMHDFVNLNDMNKLIFRHGLYMTRQW